MGRRRIVAGAVCLVGTFSYANADALEDWGIGTSATATLTTDHVWRGQSRSDNKAAVAGQFDIWHRIGLYAGTFAASSRFDDTDIYMELTPYVGFARSIGGTGISYDLMYISYNYPGTGSDFDYDGVWGTLSYDTNTFGAAIAALHEWDWLGTDSDATAYELNLTYSLPWGLKLSGALGTQRFQDESDAGVDEWTYWDLGTTIMAGDWHLDLRYHDTDLSTREFGSIYGDRLVFTLSRTF